jgi:hypothetical protein
MKACAMTKLKIQNIWHWGFGFHLLAPLNAKPIQLGAFELWALAFESLSVFLDLWFFTNT